MGGQIGIGPRLVGERQVDSVLHNGQFSKMSVSPKVVGPKVEKLPVAVRISSEFFKRARVEHGSLTVHKL
jgi:hypothetical protein